MVYIPSQAGKSKETKDDYGLATSEWSNKDYFYIIIKLNMQTFNSYRRIALWVCTNIYVVSFIYYIKRLNYYNKRRRRTGTSGIRRRE